MNRQCYLRAVEKRERWQMFAVVLGSTIIFLDGTVVNVALEEIGRTLPRRLLGRLEGQTYVYAAYLLSLSALLVPAGAASDIAGRRRIFSFGLGGFALTSLFCALAPSMEALIFARVLQGATGALVVPGALAILTAEFRGEKRGRAFGIWAGASAAATIAGPLLGGLLIQWLSWRAAFAVNIPLLLAALYATQKYVGESRNTGLGWGNMDWQGAGLSALALGGLVFGAIRGQQQQWRDPLALVALGAGAAAAFALPFLLRRSRHPLVPLDLFRSRNFSVTNISTLLIYGGIYAVHYFSPLYVQGVLGYDPAAAGASALPGWIFLAAFSAWSGKAAVRHGPRIYMTAGPALMGIGLLWFTRVPSSSAAWTLGSASDWIPPGDYLVHFLPGWILFGIGLVLLVTPLTTALMTSVPPEHAGVASAVNNAISRVGPQFASALIFIAMTSSFYGTLSLLQPALDTGSAAFRDAVSPLNEPEKGTSRPLHPSIDRASTEAFHRAIQISAGLVFAGGLVNAFGIRNKDAMDLAESPPVPARE